MWSTIFTAASTVLGRGSSETSNSGISVAEAKAAYNFEPYKMEIAEPKEAGKIGGVGAATQYNELLSAWDNYLNNEYLELSKRIFD